MCVYVGEGMRNERKDNFLIMLYIFGCVCSGNNLNGKTVHSTMRTCFKLKIYYCIESA